MADDADRAAERIANLEAGRAAMFREAASQRVLVPIVVDIDGKRVGLCHWCESEIASGTLFCPREENDCADDWEHDHKRRKDSGR